MDRGLFVNSCVRFAVFFDSCPPSPLRNVAEEDASSPASSFRSKLSKSSSRGMKKTESSELLEVASGLCGLPDLALVAEDGLLTTSAVGDDGMGGDGIDTGGEAGRNSARAGSNSSLMRAVHYEMCVVRIEYIQGKKVKNSYTTIDSKKQRFVG